jgi:diguanylate cyclase
MEPTSAAPALRSDVFAAAVEHAEREAAVDRIDRLVVEVQDGLELTADAVREMIDGAQRRGWPEVVRAAMYLELVRTAREGGAAHAAAIESLLERADADGDEAACAIALARRSRELTSRADPSMAAASDRDLARAAVLTEHATGRALDRARAHINCAIAYGLRDLWELEDEQYREAEIVLRAACEQNRLLSAILFNRVEVQANWACALRELQDIDGVEQRARAAREALRAADVPEMPAGWQAELRILAALLEAIAPDPARAPLELPAAEGEYAVHVHLALAASSTDLERALEHARAATAADRVEHPNVRSLALCMAAEIEAAIAGAETAGLAYARHLARLRWDNRLSSLASMQSLLHAERLRAEHAILSQHAYLDDLTRLGNRRALMRYLEGLGAQGVSLVAMVLVDLDRFKDVNDNFGHGMGDRTLVRLAGLLRSAVRVGDLAVRLGGDEFLLLLASARPDAARRRAEAIRVAVATEPWHEIAPELRVTASLGLACGAPQRADALIAAADSALYRAKAAGGNRLRER